jgi:hypothetical protein
MPTIITTLARRKQIYEAMHPETRRGTKGGPGRGHTKTTENISVVSFADDAAAKTGRTSRSIRADVALAGTPKSEGGRGGLAVHRRTVVDTHCSFDQ